MTQQPLPHWLADYPVRVLRGKQISVPVVLPDAERGWYRGTRFDWAGMVAGVRCWHAAAPQQHAGQVVFSPWQYPHDPSNPRHGIGPAAEFAVLGFDQAESGASFLKIGVGALIKPADAGPYRFGQLYEFAPGYQPWQVTTTPTSVRCTHQASTSGGHYGYAYVKTVDLCADGFDLTHELTNSGETTITTTCFHHNFVNVNQQAVSPSQRISCDFDLPAEPAVGKNREALLLSDRSVAVRRRLAADSSPPESVYVQLAAHAVPYAWRYHCDQLTISASSEAACTRFDVWGTSSALCPEPFTSIVLEPGETQRWTIHYRFVVHTATDPDGL